MSRAVTRKHTGENGRVGRTEGREVVLRKPGRGTRLRKKAPHVEEACPHGWLGFEPDLKQAELLRLPLRRLLLNCTRQWGKSTIAAAKAVHRACTGTQGAWCWWRARRRGRAAEFLRKAGAFVRRLGIAPRGDGDNEISLLFPNGSRIVGLPGTESTVRGFSAVSLMLIDEAARVSDELYKALRPMLAVGDGDLWLMSTPFGKRGFFYEAWEKGGPEWERVAVPATECPRIPAEFLEEERVAMGERWFRQEYLCEFVDANDVVFRREEVDRAITDEVKPLF